MSRLDAGWMKALFLTMLMALLTGCVGVSQIAICEGAKKHRDAHAEALLIDGGSQSVVTGAALIAVLDAGCGDV